MTCKKVERLLSRWLDHEVGLKEEARLLAHLKDCLECRQQKEQWEALRNDLPAVNEIEPPTDFLQRIIKQLPRSRSILSSTIFWRRPWKMAGAAGGMLALLLGAILIGHSLGTSLQKQKTSNPLPIESHFSQNLSLTRFANLPDESLGTVYINFLGEKHE